MNNLTTQTTNSPETEIFFENEHYSKSVPETDESIHSMYHGQSNDFKRRVIRKIDGFLEKIDGEEAIVCFEPDNIEMIVPSKNLCQNGICRNGQPFEFIEFEYCQDGIWYQSYS